MGLPLAVPGFGPDVKWGDGKGNGGLGMMGLALIRSQGMGAF